MKQLARFLKSTSRRLRSMSQVIGNFFRRGKLGLKVAVKIAFFVEIELSFENDWGSAKPR